MLVHTLYLRLHFDHHFVCLPLDRARVVHVARHHFFRNVIQVVAAEIKACLYTKTT